jgi:Mor family transcriptional regulator
MVKLDPEDLEIAMRKLWPHLLNELVDAFHAKEADHSLQTEGIKIVELMSQLNILYFQMN